MLAFWSRPTSPPPSKLRSSLYLPCYVHSSTTTLADGNRVCKWQIRKGYSTRAAWLSAQRKAARIKVGRITPIATVAAGQRVALTPATKDFGFRDRGDGSQARGPRLPGFLACACAWFLRAYQFLSFRLSVVCGSTIRVVRERGISSRTGNKCWLAHGSGVVFA
jgi:hypothetical protein